VDNGGKTVAGWFGKIPNLGDFASRRLPPRFLAQWDDWLQTALAGSRGLIGECWLDVYLTSPVWRFLLFPGICGDLGWTGILMPSVDRVGRYFPLTIAAELAALPASEDQLRALSDWLGWAEGVAMDALDPDRAPDDLDQALSGRSAPVFAASPQLEAAQWDLADRMQTLGPQPAVLELEQLDSLAPLLAGAGIRSLMRSGSGKSLWWSRNREENSPLLVCCTGLPRSGDFAMLLRGKRSGPETVALS
jgi:type VI secretion system protein ImpM